MQIFKEFFFICLFSISSGILWNTFYTNRISYFPSDALFYLLSKEHPEIPLLKTEEVYEMFKKGILFIDARSEEEFNKGHIKRAINIPYDEFIIAPFEYISILPLDEPIVIYCEGGSCELSFRLAEELKNLKFEKISVYYEGFYHWEKEGLPVDK